MDLTPEASMGHHISSSEARSVDTTTSSHRQHNFTLPIHSLPAELFLDILFETIDFVYEPLVPQLHVLAQVCVYWLYSIRSNSRFWHVINVAERDWAEKIVKKNPHGLLVVRCSSYDADGAEEFLHFARQHMQRWEAFTLVERNNTLSPALLDMSAPHLKIVKFSGNEDGAMIGPVHLIAPALQRVELKGAFFHWDTTPLSGLKYLRLRKLSNAGPPLKHIFAILSASPELEWLDLDYEPPATPVGNSEATLPAHLNRVVSLPALRGLACSEYVLSHVVSRIDAPNCRLFQSTILFGNFLQIGSNTIRLIKTSAQTDLRRIVVFHIDGGVRIDVLSASASDSTAFWTLGLLYFEGAVSVCDIPYKVKNYRLVIQTLGLSTELKTCPVRLNLESGPATFSGKDLSCWSSTSSIRFDRSYPHVHLALHYLSDPTKCPQLTSLSFGHDPWWAPAAHAIYGTMSDGILECLRGRCAAPPGGGPIGAGLEDRAHIVVEGGLWLIERLQGNVPEGVQLHSLW